MESGTIYRGNCYRNAKWYFSKGNVDIIQALCLENTTAV